MRIPDYGDEYLLFGLLAHNSNRLQVLGDSFYDEITTKQWFVIAMLEVFGDDHPTLNELSKDIGSSHQNVKQLVLKLEQKGYVTMYTDPTDRRKSRIKLNEKFEEVRCKYKSKQVQFIKKLYYNIDSEELKVAVRVMLKMQENMEEM